MKDAELTLYSKSERSVGRFDSFLNGISAYDGSAVFCLRTSASLNSGLSSL